MAIVARDDKTRFPSATPVEEDDSAAGTELVNDVLSRQTPFAGEPRSGLHHVNINVKKKIRSQDRKAGEKMGQYEVSQVEQKVARITEILVSIEAQASALVMEGALSDEDYKDTLETLDRVMQECESQKYLLDSTSLVA